MHSLRIILESRGLKVGHDGVTLCVVESSPSQVIQNLAGLVAGDLPTAAALAAKVENKTREKYDSFLPEDLLSYDYASKDLDLGGATRAIEALLKRSVSASRGRNT